MTFKDEKNERESVLNQETKINDRDLIKRVFKNSKKKHFDYYDSLNIINNKPFLMVQFIIIIFAATFFSLLSMTFGYNLGYLICLLALLYVGILYTKLAKIEKMIANVKLEEELKALKSKISAKWYELFCLMEQIPIEQERIEYNRKKFELEIEECKTKDDYESVLKEILNDLEKYRNVSGTQKYEEQPSPNLLSKEITNAYYELGLPPGANFQQVKTKYRELMKRYHPDSTHMETEKARKLNEAYNTLKEFLR